MTISDLFRIIEDKGWTRFFSERSYDKCLDILHLHKVSPARIEARLEENPRLCFPSVTTLDISASLNPQESRQDTHLYASVIKHFTRILPSLQQVDLSHVNTDLEIFRFLPKPECIKCNGNEGVFLCPFMFTSEMAAGLQELHLDDPLILNDASDVFDRPRQSVVNSDLSDTESDLFLQCHQLERVSMKNATFHLGQIIRPFPVFQDMLIKLVRNHPTLRWLRSDLTNENIDMLKQERPEVTLVNK